MVDLVKRDLFRSMFWPRWDDFDDMASQRGLKIRETDKDIIVEAVVAGVPLSDVEIEIDDGVLAIKAEKKEEMKDEGKHQSSLYQYYYTCALSGGQWDKADAEVKDGVVYITIPKTEAARPRKISIKAK